MIVYITLLESTMFSNWIEKLKSDRTYLILTNTMNVLASLFVMLSHPNCSTSHREIMHRCWGMEKEVSFHSKETCKSETSG